MPESMYVIVVGAGKVGWNLGRELLDKGHEVTLIEADRDRYLTVEQELEHNVQYGDASELWVLERAGISRADLVIAVTGDDEDNMLICQVAKEKYLVDRSDPAVDRARGPGVRADPSAGPAGGAARDHRDAAERRVAGGGAQGRRSRSAGGQPVDLGPARGARLRAGAGHRARAGRRDPRGPGPGGRGGPEAVLRAGRHARRDRVEPVSSS